MAKGNSSEFLFEIDTADGGSLSSGFTQYVTKFGDLDVKKESIESTPFGVTAEQYLQGVIKRHEPVTFGGFYDDTASTGPDVILNIGKITHAVTRSFSITLRSGKTVTGECWIEDYKITFESGSYHAYECTIRFTGTITWS